MWVRHTAANLEARHKCDLPVTREKVRPPTAWMAPGASRAPVPVGPPIPDGAPGDVWMCDECLAVWMIRTVERYRTPYSRILVPVWRRAGWWRTRRVRREVATCNAEGYTEGDT